MTTAGEDRAGKLIGPTSSESFPRQVLEFMFVLYDVASIMAGGEEARLEAELFLGLGLFEQLSSAGVLTRHTADGRKTYYEYMGAV